MSRIIPMRNMVANQTGTISQIKGNGVIGVRIREMGLVPGATIDILGRAPLNDPINIKLYGNNLTLRNNEADHILVEIGDLTEATEQ